MISITELTLTVDFGTTQSGSLTIHYESDIHPAIESVLHESATVEGLGKTTLFDKASVVQTLGSKLQANSSTLVPILKSIDQFKGLFDELAKVNHPSKILFLLS